MGDFVLCYQIKYMRDDDKMKYLMILLLALSSCSTPKAPCKHHRGPHTKEVSLPMDWVSDAETENLAEWDMEDCDD